MPWLFKYRGECLGNYRSQFPQDLHLILSLRMHLISSQETYVYSGFSGGHKPNLYLQWEGFCSSSPILLLTDFRSEGIERIIEDWEPQTSHQLLWVFQHCVLVGIHSFWSSFSTPVESHSCCVPCQVQFHVHLGLPCPIPKQSYSSILFSDHVYLLQVPVNLLLSL